MSDDLNREYAETDITEEEAESRRAVLENGEAAVTVEQLRLAVTAFRDVRNWRLQ